jgi:hypothetical protein
VIHPAGSAVALLAALPAALLAALLVFSARYSGVGAVGNSYCDAKVTLLT